MKKLISSATAVIALCLTPNLAAANGIGYDAHERCKKDEDKRQVIGGLAGAVVGGVVGSQISGNGARTEGSAIGAVIGGLSGAGIADKSVDCDPVYDTTETVYAPSSSGTHTTRHYGTTQYGSASPIGASTGIYEDRVTVSSHPVYSDPYYGAGAVSQGHTYSTGHTSYPPSGDNSQYAYETYNTVQGARDYTAPYYNAPQPAVVQQQVVYSQPATQRHIYSQPVSIQPVYHQPTRVTHGHHTVSRRHYHGRYSCDMVH